MKRTNYAQAKYLPYLAALASRVANEAYLLKEHKKDFLYALLKGEDNAVVADAQNSVERSVDSLSSKDAELSHFRKIWEKLPDDAEESKKLDDLIDLYDLDHYWLKVGWDGDRIMAEISSLEEEVERDRMSKESRACEDDEDGKGNEEED